MKVFVASACDETASSNSPDAYILIKANSHKDAQFIAKEYFDSVWDRYLYEVEQTDYAMALEKAIEKGDMVQPFSSDSNVAPIDKRVLMDIEM